MPNLAPLSDDQATGDAKVLFDDLMAKIKAVPNFFRTLGHAPEVLRHTLGLDAAIHAHLDPKLRELAYLKTAQVLGCGY
jgi:alkylhydroperoxidase family enzyme